MITIESIIAARYAGLLTPEEARDAVLAMLIEAGLLPSADICNDCLAEADALAAYKQAKEQK